METEEIYSFSIYPLVTSTFAVEWSEDNHISVLTEKGINILELIPSPMSPYSTIKFSRSFVYAPQTLPTERISKKIESKIWNMDRESLYSFMMDESLTPKLSNVKEIVPKIVDLAWSPQDLLYPSKCLLAILTSAGAIAIIYKISTDWYPAYDLSSVRNNSIESEIVKKLKGDKTNSHNFEILRNYLKTLKPSCFAWSMLFIDFAYFTVAYQNGDIIIYKIPRISDYNEMGNPEIVGTIQLNEYVKVSALCWITVEPKEQLIIVGYFDGRIYGLKVKEQDQIFRLESTEKYYDYTDRIPINAIRIFDQNSCNVKALIAKGSFLFLLRFSRNGTLQSMQHLQLEGFAISGMTCINADYALVAVENNSLFSINTENNQFLKAKLNNKLSHVHVRYLGLAHSQSSVIFVNVTSPGTIYDHLVVKEPTKICFFGLKDKRWNPLFILEQNKTKNFEKLWDCLEVIRMKATRASDLSTLLLKIPSNLESLSLLQLRIAMWLSVIIEICEKKKVIQGISSIAGEISEAQPLIFVHSACNYLTHLQSKSSLIQDQKLSMHLLRMYLEGYLAREKNEELSPLCKRTRDVLNKMPQLSSTNIETCNLCEETMSDFSLKITKCPQGHILPRCAITLLQITTVQYKTCPICGLIFHSCLDQEFKETRCLFCDVPALQENRVLNTKFYISKEKSLSRPRNRITEIAEDREMETVVDES